MVRLLDLPTDILRKILGTYLVHCNGTPVAWRLVCKDLRAIATAESNVSCLQFMGVSVALMYMMRRWIRNGCPVPMCDSNGRIFGRVSESHLLEAIAKYNNAAVFQEIITDINFHVRHRYQRLTNVVCAAGALETLQLLVHHGLSLNAVTCEHAVQYGHANVVAWHLEVQKNRNQFDAFLLVYDRASKLADAEWKFPHPIEGSVQCSMNLVKQFTSLEGYSYLLERAVQHGHFDIMMMLLPLARRSEGKDLLAPIANHAAEHGQLKILQWAARQMGGAFSNCAERVWFEAAHRGHLELLKWLCPQFSNTVSCAIQMTTFRYNAGNLELVQWLVEEQGMQLTPETMFTAMFAFRYTDNFAVMDYLYTKKCPRVFSCLYDYDDEYKCAAQMRDQTAHKLMQWLYNHGYEVPLLRGEEAMREAMKADVVDVVAKLFTLGVRFDPEWYGSVNYYEGGNCRGNWEHRAVVAWARQSGYDIPAYK